MKLEIGLQAGAWGRRVGCRSSHEESSHVGWEGAEQEDSRKKELWTCAVCVCVCVRARAQGKDLGEDRVSIPGPQLLQPKAERGAGYRVPEPPTFPWTCTLGSDSGVAAPRPREVSDVPTPGPAASPPRSSAMRTRESPERTTKSSEVWRAAGKAGPPAASKTGQPDSPPDGLPPRSVAR